MSYMKIGYTQCTVKLRLNFQKIAQLKCTTNVYFLCIDNPFLFSVHIQKFYF